MAAGLWQGARGHRVRWVRGGAIDVHAPIWVGAGREGGDLIALCGAEHVDTEVGGCVQCVRAS